MTWENNFLNALNEIGRNMAVEYGQGVFTNSAILFYGDISSPHL